MISEIVNSENTELIVQVGVKDFLISNQFVSRIFAQVALEKDVMHVYDDLFQKEGSEIYIKPIDLYFEQPEGLNVTLQTAYWQLNRGMRCALESSWGGRKPR